jgi:ubiquinone/menaquinone biosynthesis C-methylase UbiE
MADEYCQNKNIKLKIKKGDMRNIEFDSNSFGFTYTYNTIFHLTKKDTKIAFDEMFRILKKNGLLFVNLLSVEDSSYGNGKEVRPGEFVEKYDDEEVLHCYYTDNEADDFFKNHKIIYKEKRRVFINEASYLPGMLDYIIKKK